MFKSLLGRLIWDDVVGMLRFILFCILVNGSAYSWNAMGHRLVAQIAYDQLRPEVKSWVKTHSRPLSKPYQTHHIPYAHFIAASVWLDAIRAHDVHWYDALHYIDIPYAPSHSGRLPAIQKINALWGIKQALLNLNSRYSNREEKALSLRILTHIVGDIHQPLHTASLISERHPHGDLGGNLFLLGKNSFGKNLHQYWDNGAGVFRGISNPSQLKSKARQLEKRWPCALANQMKTPNQWVSASHHMAKDKVYTIEFGVKPTQHYERMTRRLSEQQIVFAGCRLGFLLNGLKF